MLEGKIFPVSSNPTQRPGRDRERAEKDARNGGGEEPLGGGRGEGSVEEDLIKGSAGRGLTSERKRRGSGETGKKVKRSNRSKEGLKRRDGGSGGGKEG